MTFALGGLSFWMAAYLIFRKQPPKWQPRFLAESRSSRDCFQRSSGDLWQIDFRSDLAGSYFLVSGVGMLLAFPLMVAVIYTPFPIAWVLLFGAVFFVFLNTGPSNAALANVAVPKIRATAFAVNILVIHLFGDAFSPPLLGAVAGHYDMNIAFLVISASMLISGVIWLLGMKYLAADTAAVEAEQTNAATPICQP